MVRAKAWLLAGMLVGTFAAAPLSAQTPVAAPDAAASASAADIAAGMDSFGDRCSACHVLNGAAGQGPNLVGVVGRPAASYPGFKYTAALKASGLTWTPANLDIFLSGPSKMVPGTVMPAIVPSPDERRQLIAYLASLKPAAN